MLEFVKYLPSQENIDCCAASASLLAAEIIMAKNNQPKHFSRLFPYYMARKMQNRIGQKGTDLKTILESLSLYGVCLDQQWPLRPSLIDKEPSKVAIQEADRYKVGSYEYVQFSDFNKFVENNIPVIIGMRTGKQFWKLTGKLEEQKYCPVNDTDNRYSHGHAVVIVGNRPDLNSWIVANSKGLKWGDRGFGILPYECYVDIGESYAITSFTGFMAGKKISDN